jgi:hypothetical protein
MKTAIAVLLMAFGTSISAEELLISPAKSEYLGWKKSNVKFKTCPGGYMQILDGYAVNPTKDRCIGNHFKLSGILEAVDLLIPSFTFRSSGDRMKFFVRKETSGGLRELPPQETFVTVDVDAKKLKLSWTVDGASRSATFEKALDPEDKPAPR